MEIIKELNLNKNPQAVKNGSLVSAWNIKLSKDGSYITSDDSLIDVIQGKVLGKIVGIIPCNKEFVVFTDADRVYRSKENDNGDIDSVDEVQCGWYYGNSRHVKGTYTYNVNNELIVAIIEDGDNVPLKTINLDKCQPGDKEDQYTPAPNVPVVNMSLVDRIAGTPIPQGLYYFFVRFKCQDETYTNWFPVGVPQYAIARRPVSVSLGWEPRDYIGSDFSTTKLNKTQFDCPYGFKFHFTINNVANTNYSKMQIGYILQHDNGSFGRKWHEVNLTSTSFDLLFDAVNPQEESIENLLENPIALYDVSNIAAYENRLYIANFKETNYDVQESLAAAASQIRVKQYISNAEKFKIAGQTEEEGGDDTPTPTPTPDKKLESCDYRIKIYKQDGNEYLSDPFNVSVDNSIFPLYDYTNQSVVAEVRKAINDAVMGKSGYDGFWVSYLTGNRIESQDFPGNYYQEVAHIYTNRRDDVPTQPLLYIKVPHNGDIDEEKTLTLTDSAGRLVPMYQFFYNDGRLRQEFSEGYETGYGADQLVGLERRDDNDPSLGYWICGAVENEVQHIGYFNTILGYFLRCVDMKIIKVKEYYVDGTSVSGGGGNTSTNNDSGIYKYNERIENSVRTLMPNEVYAFYVHYVRKDGSYTNGIQLFNNGSSNIEIDSQSINEVSSTGTEIATAISDAGYKSYENLKNCELHSYGIPNETLSDFKVYENINNDKLFLTCNGYTKTEDNDYTPCKIVPIFTNITIPTGFVGVFFSYAKVDPLSLYYAYIKQIPDDNQVLEYKANDVETGLITYVGSLAYDVVTGQHAEEYSELPYIITESAIYISNSANRQYNSADIRIDKDLNNRSQISTFGLEGAIGLNIYKLDIDSGMSTLHGLPSTIALTNIRRNDNSIYSDKTAILISLGQILTDVSKGIYGEHIDCPIYNEEFNYPSFVTRDKILTYKGRIYIADNGALYTADSKGIISSSSSTNVGDFIQLASIINVIKHSNYNLDALSVKKEPEYVVRGNQSGISGGGVVVKPINATDFITYPGDFVEKPYKSYVNNDPDRYVWGKKTSVIRRSDILHDESLENTLRYFRPTQYKVIPSDKGKITNLIGLGYYFLVHTEHTLFIIDRSNLLKGATENVQVATPSTFDIEPKEAFTSTHGYGGLQTDSWTVNHNGYFFFDKDSLEIYNTDSGNLKALTAPIKNVIKNINPDNAAFVTDFDNDRIIMCFKKGTNYFTITYNMLTNTYISLHNFAFDYGYNTKNRFYLLNNKDTKLGTADVSRVREYGNWFKSLIPIAPINSTAVNYNNSPLPSVVDIIINPNFEVIKSLNAISWIIKLIEADYNNLETNVVEHKNYSAGVNMLDTFNRKEFYAGEILRIYSDLTDSLDLDIQVNDNINKFNDYKHPHFDKGNWYLNYFRNHLAKTLTNDEKVKSDPDNNKHFNNYTRSDNRGLLYGRYFVLRFVFGCDSRFQLPFMFNNIDLNINKY